MSFLSKASGAQGRSLVKRMPAKALDIMNSLSFLETY